MIIQNDKLSFLKKFSEEEWKLNGHKKINTFYLMNMYDALAKYIQEGKYLEMGCGTGILSKYLKLFSGKKIEIFGIDINQRCITLAKNNNKDEYNNFYCENYFYFYPKKQTSL